MILKSLETFVEIAKSKGTKKIAVAAAADLPVLQAVKQAKDLGIADAFLVGDKAKIESIAKEIDYNLSDVTIIDEPNAAIAAKLAVKEIRSGNAEILMKGLVGSADYLRAILNKEEGLRKGKLLSHVGFFEVDNYHKLVGVTDAAQNVAPTLEEKIVILNNAVELMNRLGIEVPKVAGLAAVETVSPKMEATMHAATMTMMNKRKQIKNCIFDGPLAMDNAVSKEASEHKGIESEVAGDADLFFVPDIEAGNILYKTLTYLCKGTVAAVVLGATVPIVLTSRADSERSKLMSIALAAAY